MSVSKDRDTREITVTCDGCPQELDTETDNFALAMVKRREAGWGAEPYLGTAWLHFCPVCREARKPG